MKRAASLIISLMMLIGLAAPAFAAANSNLFSVGNPTTGSTVYDDTPFKLTLPVTVNSADIASFTATLSELDGTGISPLGTLVQTITTTKEAGKLYDVDFSLNGDSGLKSGYAYLTLTIVGTKTDGSTVTDTFSEIKLKKVNESDETSSDDEEANTDFLRITDFTVNPQTVQAGSDFDLSVSIQNTADFSIYDVQVTVDATSADTFSMAEGIESQYIKVSKATKAVPHTTASFKLHASDKLTTARTPLSITISYKTKNGTAHTNTAHAFISIQGKEDDTSSGGVAPSTPVMIIEQYSFGDSSVTAGGTFPLQMTFFNTGDIALENVKITLSDKDGVFTPANSSNTLFIESIPAKSRVSKTVDFTAKADTEAKSYTIAVNCDYEAIIAKERKALTTDEVLAIPLTQIDRFEAGEVQCWGDVMVGQETGLYVDYVNKGKSKIFNLSVSIEGDFEVSQNQTMYIGNVESGTGNSYEAYIIPGVSGSAKGTVTFEYEDSNNEKKTLVKEFSLDVVENMWNSSPDIPIDGGIDVPVEPKGLPTIAIVGIVAGGVIVVAVVVVIILKARKRKKNRIEDENEDF